MTSQTGSKNKSLQDRGITKKSLIKNSEQPLRFLSYLIRNVIIYRIEHNMLKVLPLLLISGNLDYRHTVCRILNLDIAIRTFPPHCLP